MRRFRAAALISRNTRASCFLIGTTAAHTLYQGRFHMVVFKGSNGVRAGWRFAGYLVLTIGLIFVLQGYFGQSAAAKLHIDLYTLNAPAMLVSEICILLAVLLSTGLAAVLEHRNIFSYGLPVRDAFRGKYWEGNAIGIVSAGFVGCAMFLTGCFKVNGFGLHGAQWVAVPLLWALVMALVGIAEEAFFRGYGLQALARGTGFWPAAIISSLLFGALHIPKPDENVIDIFNIMALGLITCFALWRTGNLWWAVGFHTAFDFMQFFVIGTPNGGQHPVGTLLQVAFRGPAWITGGPLGVEASYLMLPVMLLILTYLYFRYPATPQYASKAA